MKTLKIMAGGPAKKVTGIGDLAYEAGGTGGNCRARPLRERQADRRLQLVLDQAAAVAEDVHRDRERRSPARSEAEGAWNDAGVLPDGLTLGPSTSSCATSTVRRSGTERALGLRRAPP